MAAVVTKLFRQIRGKAKEIDHLLAHVDGYFPAKECSSQMMFQGNMKRWMAKAGKQAAPAIEAGQAGDLPSVSEAVRELIGDEGDTKDMDLSLGFEIMREMSRHLNGLQIALEWSELVKQSVSAENISDSDLIGIERGALLVDRAAQLLVQDEEDDDYCELANSNLPLFGPDYQSSGLHPMDRATMDELDEIADMVRIAVKEHKKEVGHEPSPVEVLVKVNKILFEDVGYQEAQNADQYHDTKYARMRGLLKTRQGSRVPLGILHAAISSRLGLNVRGVRLPSYFLLRVAFGHPETATATEKKFEVEEATEDDIKTGVGVEVYWNGDDKWYPAYVDRVEGNVLFVNYWDADTRHKRLEMKNLNRMPDLHQDTLVFRILKNRPGDTNELTIGRRVEVFWTIDNTWYTATVKWLDQDSGNVLVQYDDGDERNTALSLTNFGAPPVPPSETEEPPLVFRLFERPFSDDSDSTSCFVDPTKKGKVLSHAETSHLLREHGIQSSKFQQHLAPIPNHVVWLSMLKHLVRLASQLDKKEEVDLWSGQMADLRKLELHANQNWTPAMAPAQTDEATEVPPEAENK
uniref:Tudor domain-containing protein n=1 Tax=Lotharella globosa TaxID=91324 RepID=A0A7S4DZL3_9EUKA|eukprot:CAMPEP_0167796320 /NCGR_PEP_ID=MMETSP0111_2-20121227/14971_1 /TAXON_ID=91324 /ORGANISM="Lotharella globosa, Strain CCCM811" /LENGTH=576 /DNA_ID=CAMNT_0007690177 /DNA_START=115 /DNA_END=1845 /DNA_ORIENTATION=-